MRVDDAAARNSGAPGAKPLYTAIFVPDMSFQRLVRLASALLATLAVCVSGNDRPIIGILAQDVSATPSENNSTYISASYVKFIEQAGARVVPILVNREEDYYVKTFNSVNGILFPGGGVDAVNSSYGRAAAILFGLAMEANRNGTVFPIWGTCLGLELVARLAAGGRDVLKQCKAQGVGMPLNFTDDFRESRLFRHLPVRLENVLRTKPMTYNAHHFCLTLEDFQAYNLGKFFKILSTNEDLKGVTFVSSIEAISVPVFAVQFHPEMAVFEWGDRSPERRNLHHNWDTAMFSQFLANFFVEQARHNEHHFPSKDEERKALIYNYQPVFTEDVDSFTQMYFFE